MLSFLDSGRIKVDHQRKSYDFEIRGAKVFATRNEIKPLQSRFRRLHLPSSSYSLLESFAIGLFMLQKRGYGSIY